MIKTVTIAKGFDAHCHFRQGDMLKKVVPHIARYNAGAVAMPNTDPPIETGAQVATYHNEIVLAAEPVNPDFQIAMAIALTRNTTPEIVREAAGFGAKILKWIPQGVSTNSATGVPFNEIHKFYPAL